MVDAEVARRRLREMDRRLGALADLRSRGSEVFLADAGVQAQVERHLQLAIQAAIDIAVHVLAEDSPSTPETYGAAFTALAEMEVIPTGCGTSSRTSTTSAPSPETSSRTWLRAEGSPPSPYGDWVSCAANVF